MNDRLLELINGKLNDMATNEPVNMDYTQFTQKEIAMVQRFNPTAIDIFNANKHLIVPQEASWQIIKDSIAGYYVHIRFGKTVYGNLCQYYVMVEGVDAVGKISYELKTDPAPSFIAEKGAELLKSVLERYILKEEAITPVDDAEFKKEVRQNLNTIVTKVYSFAHEAEQVYRFKQIDKELNRLEAKFPKQRAKTSALRIKFSKIERIQSDFDDVYYEIKEDMKEILK